jgi:SSS family solute:Na+ symporter
MITALIVARPLLGNFTQAFQYIQEFTGFFTPGVCALFLLGFFWNKTTANAALATAIGSAVFSVAFKLLWPELPFIDRVGIVFLLCMSVGIGVSAIQGAEPHPDAIDYKDVDTSTTTEFNVAAFVIVLMLAALYATWW